MLTGLAVLCLVLVGEVFQPAIYRAGGAASALVAVLAVLQDDSPAARTAALVCGGLYLAAWGIGNSFAGSVAAALLCAEWAAFRGEVLGAAVLLSATGVFLVATVLGWDRA
jgi:hypothetical protein